MEAGRFGVSGAEHRGAVSPYVQGMNNTDPMPCGNTCGSCPLTSLCHQDNDGPDIDPAEVAARLIEMREAQEADAALEPSASAVAAGAFLAPDPLKLPHPNGTPSLFA